MPFAKESDDQLMNQILYNREMFLNRDNEGIIAELLRQKEGYNTIWGQEFIMMNGASFMNNADNIIEIMVKCRK